MREGDVGLSNVSVSCVSFSICGLISLNFRQCWYWRSPEGARPGGGCQELSFLWFRLGILLARCWWEEPWCWITDGNLSFRLLSVAHHGAFTLKIIGAHSSIQVKFCLEAGKCNYSGSLHKDLHILQFSIIVAMFQAGVNKPVLVAGKVFCASMIKVSVWIKYSI